MCTQGGPRTDFGKPWFIWTPMNLAQGSHTLFLERYLPVGFCSNRNLVHLILYLTRAINLSRAGVPLAEPLHNIPLKRQRAKFKSIFFEICNFHTLTNPIQQMKDKHLVNLPIVSDFKNALQRMHNIWLLGHIQVKKTQPFFQPKRGVTKSRNIDKINH